MSKVTVEAGSCGFKTVVHAEKTGEMNISVRVSSGCEMLTNMNPELAALNWRQGVFGPIGDCKVYEICSGHIQHTACPVPVAILKAIEVEVGLAVPVDVTMKVEGNDPE